MTLGEIIKKTIRIITMVILIVLIIVVLILVILKNSSASKEIYGNYYDTLINKTLCFAVIAGVLWAFEYIVTEIILCRKVKTAKRCIIGIILVVLMIMPVCVLTNMFKDSCTDYIKYFNDLKYVVKNKPLSKTEICIFTCELTEKHNNYFEFLEKYDKKPVFETETLCLNVISAKYDSTECSDMTGDVVKVKYLPNTNLMIDCVSTNYSVGAINATQMKEKKLKLNTSRENLYDEYSEVGSLYLKNQDYDKALSYFSKGIALIDKDTSCPWGIYCDRASCYDALSEHQKSIADMNKAIELSIINGLGDMYADGFRMEIAETYESIGDYALAINEYKGVTTSDSRRDDGINEVLKKKSKYEKLKYEESTPKPKNYDYYLNLGQDWYDDDFYEIGVQNLTKAIDSFKPDSYKPFYYRGLCYLKLHNYSKAALDLNKAIAYLPEGDEDDKSERIDTYKALGESYMGLKQYEKAIDAYKKPQSDFFNENIEAAQKVINENENFTDYEKNKQRLIEGDLNGIK